MKILNRQHYIPLGIVLLLTLVMIKLPSRTATQIKLAVSGLFLPLFGLTQSAEDLADKAATTLVSRSELSNQIRTLKQENDRLRIHVQRSSGINLENQRLRQALNLGQRLPLKLKMAQVIGREPANWWRTIRINVGIRDGIPTNAPVLTSDGLVGRVSQLGYSQSQVILLGDPECRVAALIEETRDHGVIAPDSSNPMDNILVDMNYLSRTSRLKAGQTVVTSGLGGIFPKDIAIGKIVDFRSVDFGLYYEARVRVTVNLNALEEVWVMMR